MRGVTPDKTIDFSFGPTPFIDHHAFESKTNYVETLPLGTVTHVSVTGVSMHPFHTHVNPFQIVNDPADTVDGYFRSGDWHDVVVSPNYQMDVRMQTDRFSGPMVFHCHDLDHEDHGMMAVTLLEGDEGTEWPKARDIDPTCYRGLQVGAPTISDQGTCGSGGVGPGSGPSASPSGGTTSVPTTTLCFEGDCVFKLMFRASPTASDHMEITVSYKGHSWLGVGVSPDGQMGPLAVAVIATWKTLGVETHIYGLAGRTAEAVVKNWKGFAEVESVTRDDGHSDMVFNMPYTDRCTLLLHS